MSKTTSPSQDVQEMVAQADTGARAPLGIPGRILWFVRYVGHYSNFGTHPLCRSYLILAYSTTLKHVRYI